MPEADRSTASRPPPAMAEVEKAFARCFAGPDGTVALAYLRGMTLERALGPDADAAALRHLEGQRQLVTRIAGLVQRGREGGGPARPDDTDIPD